MIQLFKLLSKWESSQGKCIIKHTAGRHC